MQRDVRSNAGAQQQPLHSTEGRLSTGRLGTARLAAAAGLAWAAWLVACGASEPQPSVAPTGSASGAASGAASASAPAPASASVAPVASSAAAPAAPLPPVVLAVGTPAPDPEKMPSLSIQAPANDAVIAADKVADTDIKLALKDWDTSKGAHVHLILDGQPYLRVDDASKPVKLGAVAPGYTLAEGQHVLVAFPSRNTHESVKPKGASKPLAVVSFWVGKKGKPTWSAKDPTLVYSRPKGENKNPTLPPEGVLVDFYLANAELGAGKYAVEATLTGPGLDTPATVRLTNWVPLRIQQPRTGTYRLRLALLDKAGKPVPGAFNDVTREFSVDTTPITAVRAPAGPHAGH